jgi:WD40 repeat protein/tetratricopeptide (TPR) repeat protein
MADNRADAPTSSFPTLGGYEILAELNRDRLGIVYRARQVLYNREVALRLIDEQARGKARDLTDACHIAEAVGRLHHPHLVPLVDDGEDEGQFYLASELPPGPTLRQRLASGGPLSPEEVAALVGSVARTVGHLHEHHLLHLGLTSACVFLAGDGSARIGDLGLAGVLQHHPDVPFPGDSTYAAPEQRAGSRAEAPADVYALGCLLHECLTGRPPMDGIHLKGVPAALAWICRKALASSPERRYASASELADELGRFGRGEAVLPGVLPRLLEWARRKPEVTALSVVLALVLVGSVALAVVFALQAVAHQDQSSRSQAEAQRLRHEADTARTTAEKAAQKSDLLKRAAEHKAHLANLDREEMGKRVNKETALRQTAEQRARDEAKHRASAEERAREADEARQAAEATRADAGRQLIRLHIDQGAAMVDSGDLAGALAPFARALAVARREKLPLDAHQLRIGALLSRCPRPLCVLGYPKGDVTSVLFSPNGERLVTIGADGVIKVRSALTGTLVGKQLVHGALVTAAAFSPNSKQMLSADRQGRLRLWNIEDGSEVFEAVELEAAPLHVGFSGDGKRLITVQPVMADEPAAIATVRDAQSGETIGVAVTNLVAPQPASLSPDGKRVLVVCTDRAARIHDVETGNQIGPALRHDNLIMSATFSGDGRLVLTSGLRTARVWNASTGKPAIAPLEHNLPYSRPQLDDSGRVVLVPGKDRAVHIHDTASGKSVGPALHTRSALHLAVLSPDGRHALLAGSDGVVTLFDVVSGQAALPALVHGRPLMYASLAGDGSRALTFDGRAVRVWDTTAGEPLSPAALPSEDGVTYSPDGKRLARVQGDSVQVHETRTHKPLGVAIKHKGEVQRVAFSPKGDLLLTSSKPPDATAGTPTWDVRVWDADTGKPISEVIEHLRGVQQAFFVASGTRVLTISQDQRVRLWDAKTGKSACKSLEHPEDVLLAELSLNGRHLITCDATGVTRAWDAATGNRVGEAMAHARPVRFVAFGNEGKYLATCSEDGTARVWEVATGKRLAEVEHAAAVTSAAFSPDAKLLLTGSADGTARAWDLETGKPRTPPLRHDEAVQRTAFSETGRWLLTAAGRFVRVWDIQTGEPIGPPLPHSTESAAVTRMSLSKAGELMTEAGPGTLWARMLVPDTRTDADLTALARVLAGRDESGSLDAGDLEAAWNKATARDRAEFQPPRARLLAWARRGANECEARGLWGGVVRHLDVLMEESADASLYARRGKARAHMAIHDGALADYDKALAKESGRWDWWAGRADAAAARKRWDRAAQDYTQATKLQPRRGELWQRLGRVEAERGQWKQAAASLALAIRFGVNDAATMSDHALAQLKAGDAKGYRQTCARLVKKFAAQADVVDVCVLLPDTIDFKPLLERAEKVASDDAAVQTRLAALLLRASQTARAVTLLEKLTAGEQPRPIDLWLLVLAYQRAGEKDKAKQAMTKATETKERSGAPWQERQAVALLQKEAGAK